jgi:transcriptional regulator with XRE-family HTH domain
MLKLTPKDIQTIREAYNLTPTQFARVMAISRPTIYAWESGRTVPGPHERMILWRLAEATHDPQAFTNTFLAIKKALTYQQSAPPSNASPWKQESSSSFADNALAFGLGALLGVLFAKAAETSEDQQKESRENDD